MECLGGPVDFPAQVRPPQHQTARESAQRSTATEQHQHTESPAVQLRTCLKAPGPRNAPAAGATAGVLVPSGRTDDVSRPCVPTLRAHARANVGKERVQWRSAGLWQRGGCSLRSSASKTCQAVLPRANGVCAALESRQMAGPTRAAHVCKCEPQQHLVQAAAPRWVGRGESGKTLLAHSSPPDAWPAAQRTNRGAPGSARQPRHPLALLPSCKRPLHAAQSCAAHEQHARRGRPRLFAVARR